MEKLAENGWIPDYLLRRGIQSRCWGVLAEQNTGNVEKDLQNKLNFVKKLKESPIAVQTKTANEQHYEVPTEFFQLVMGKHLKYSSCFYDENTTSLDQAEKNMLEIYCERAKLSDGLQILDLGCGWGSFTLFAAAKYPNAKITSLSNSKTQRAFIEEQAKQRGLKNIQVFTGDITQFNEFKEGSFDRVISIEMFEHMKNYERLLAKVSSWMKSDGLLFIHIFTHKQYAYDYKSGDWMTDFFFSGGTMPSADLLLYFQQNVSLVDQWAVSGTHYSKTSNHWLENMDKNIKRVREIFQEVYGKENVQTWIGRWRLFFLAVAEFFGLSNGQEWGVTHYLFQKKIQNS